MQKRRATFLVQHIVSDLNLSDGQRAQIKTVLQNEQPKIQELLTKAQQANDQLRSEKSFDETFVRSVAQQQTSSMTEALVERERVRAEIMAVLNPDQQHKFTQLTNQFRAAIQERISTLGDEL